MNIENLLDEISNCSLNNEIKNSKPLDLLEYIRLNIIEKLRSQNNKKTLELINLIKKNNNLKKTIKIDELDLIIIFNYYDEERNEKRIQSKNNALEIVLNGQKNYQIFDNDDKEKYILYKIMPFYGVVYSANTLISYKTIKKTTLLNINIEDKSKKE